MSPTVDGTNPWSTHRRRAEELRGRYPFAAEILGLYRALLDVWGEVWALAREDRPTPPELPDWSVSHALPRVVKVTEAAGPAALVAAAHELVADGSAADSFRAWLAGSDPPPAQTYLAHACLRPGLVALEDAGEACAADPAPRGGQHCPRCGGRPQFSFRAAAGDQLVSGGRHLCCVRCGHTWSFSASTCPSCGETAGARRTLYSEQRAGPVVGPVGPDDGGPDDGATHPHVRIEACASCQRYLLDIDLGRAPAAVPEVDELAAVPLALYASDLGLTKITPNLMGF